jgi:hypothetical protein
MRAIGIEIKGGEVIFCVLEKDNEILMDITGKLTKVGLVDDENSNEIHKFIELINTHFDSLKPDKIGIIRRSRSIKGKFITSPISFKLEGLIQTYKNKDIEFIAPQTLSAYFKKNSKGIAPKNKYQDSACDLALFLLRK